jgi:hypothetical protein
MPRVALVLLALGLVVVVSPSRARADEKRPKIGVLEIIIEGDAPAELRKQLDRSFAGGLYAAGYEVVPRDQVQKALKKTPELVGCLTTTCLARVSDVVGTRLFARARVTANGAAYTVELELLSVDDASGPIGRVEKTCPVCTIDEANELLSKAAMELRPGHKDPRGGEGAGGDGAPRAPTAGAGTGSGGATGAGATGAGVTGAGATGSGAAGGEVADGGGRGQGPGAGGDDAGLARPRWRTWKWATAGGAGVALIAGVWLIVIDGDGTDCPSMPVGSICKNVYDTTTGGVLLTLTGVGLAGAATWMWIDDRKRERGLESVGLAPLPGGVGLVARGHF